MIKETGFKGAHLLSCGHLASTWQNPGSFKIRLVWFRSQVPFSNITECLQSLCLMASLVKRQVKCKFQNSYLMNYKGRLTAFSFNAHVPPTSHEHSAQCFIYKIMSNVVFLFHPESQLPHRRSKSVSIKNKWTIEVAKQASERSSGPLVKRSSDLTRNSKTGKSVKREHHILENKAHGSDSKERKDYLIKIIA